MSPAERGIRRKPCRGPSEIAAGHRLGTSQNRESKMRFPKAGDEQFLPVSGSEQNVGVQRWSLERRRFGLRCPPSFRRSREFVGRTRSIAATSLTFVDKTQPRLLFCITDRPSDAGKVVVASKSHLRTPLPLDVVQFRGCRFIRSHNTLPHRTRCDAQFERHQRSRIETADRTEKTDVHGSSVSIRTLRPIRGYLSSFGPNRTR